MKIKITARDRKPFTGSSGEVVEYFWYKGVRLDDKVSIRFGSRDGDHEVDETLDLNIEKYEKPNGEFAYKEVI